MGGGGGGGGAGGFGRLFKSPRKFWGRPNFNLPSKSSICKVESHLVNHPNIALILNDNCKRLTIT